MKAYRLITAPVAAVLFSGPLLLAAPITFQRGDANGDARLDLSDSVFTLSLLFLGGAPASCQDAADANDDGALDVSDGVHVLSYLFLGGRAPASPTGRCGVDATADALSCESYPPCGPDGQSLDPRLLPAGQCEEVLSALRRKVREDMESALERNKEIAREITRHGCQFWMEDVRCPFCGVAPVPPPAEAAGGAPAEYSGTNNQVEGVDEADFLKTDGAFIYILAEGKFQVIDSWPPTDARRVAAVEVAGTPRKLFVHADRAVVYSSLEPLHPPSQWPPNLWGGPFAGDPGECTYGYDGEFTGDGRRLKVTVLDISDRASPRLLREIEFDGSYLGARRIGDKVHTVVISPEATVPGVAYWPEELKDLWDACRNGAFPYTEEQVLEMFGALRERNLALIEGALAVDLLPSMKDTRHENGVPRITEGFLQGCRDFYLSPSPDGASLLSLVSFEIDEVQDLRTTTVLGRPGAVYASRDSLYLASRHRREDGVPWYFGGSAETPEATTIHKFQLFYDRPGSSYLGSGVVKGRILNQFSMDEHQGYLRVATTTGRVPSPDVHSTVSVLAQDASSLVPLGRIDRIAPTEDIRSVRFNGNVGYLVTFKKTDPLYVLDLSDPESPAIRGELKIPGFSTYMHLLGDRHILALGYDAEDHGSFAFFQGMALQVFDVGDPATPRLLHKVVIGTRGSTSDAATDHLAFNYFASRGLLAVPMVVCESGAGGKFGDRISFSGLMVYRVDLEEGFRYLGGVPHALPEPGGNVRISCNNWWTQPNSQVKRSIFMDSFVYSVALDRINVSSLEDLEHPIAGIPLEE